MALGVRVAASDDGDKNGDVTVWVSGMLVVQDGAFSFLLSALCPPFTLMGLDELQVSFDDFHTTSFALFLQVFQRQRVRDQGVAGNNNKTTQLNAMKYHQLTVPQWTSP